MFSVLMSIYHKENPTWFDRAMQSIWDEQTVKPDEIVLVLDGKLTDELYSVIDKWQEKLEGVLKQVPLEENVGLGDALNIGMQHCTYELIARMDTDDISLPHRFEKQLEVFQTQNVDVCSAWISEFDSDEKEILGYRKLPETHDEILKYGKLRSPVNHIPVMYKKSAVLKAGNYGSLKQAQDYELWGRMFLSGARFYNIQEVLANIRAGYGQLERRSGLAYAKRELALLNALRKNGFLNSFEYLRAFCIKIPIRLLPKKIIKIVYKFLRKS